VAAAWFGSTFGCAECHDHKFDPIKTRDFYELQAFFADVKQWGIYAYYGYNPAPELAGFNNAFPFPPEIEVESPWLKKRSTEAKRALESHLKAGVERLEADPAAMAARQARETSLAPFLKAHPDGWSPISPGSTQVLGQNGQPVPGRTAVVTVALDKPLAKGETVQIPMETTGLPSVAAFRVEVVTDASDAPTKLGKSITLSLKLQPAEGKARNLPIRIGEATAKRPTYKDGAEIIGLRNEWRLPNEVPANGKLRSVWLLDMPVTLKPGDQLVAVLSGDNLLPIRFFASPLGALEPLQAGDSATLKTLAVAPDKRTPAQAALAARAFLLSTAHDRAAFVEANELAAKARELSEGRTWTLVTEAVANPLPIRVLPRGNWQDETGAVVLPSTPSFLPGRIESTENKRLTRLDLANWIVSAQNPITARAVMNRLWALLFGTGLSSAVDDLGSQGELPSNPELLDWLASEFRDSGSGPQAHDPAHRHQRNLPAKQQLPAQGPGDRSRQSPARFTESPSPGSGVRP